MTLPCMDIIGNFEKILPTDRGKKIKIKSFCTFLDSFQILKYNNKYDEQVYLY